ncbi:TetR family transcriptional regulator [Asanoa ishikariensis]|uniref:Transcriptional regulator, TetR family n=1 Tax=Asanoa ishikariensis TaxID=137265 RepID=A0A1H3S9Z6_9ACTN|nr:TetR/AcrR family transcriptional regulator [Asanoa ishikariensis]GIF70278.1 TetR family transcriptional regulator [Asanoa ishikariensis]SDZ34458.1 transcriptional regulator, TetR family [Asanoa ishikariensis]
MTETEGRRRAPGMSPEQRRETVVRAALPLVSEHGAAVTTAQIARAAGIGEATIFRVFDDKQAVLEAVVAAALDPTVVLQELRSIALDQPLAVRLVDAADALDAHFARVGSVLGALHATGRTGPRREPVPGGRERSVSTTFAAIAEIIEPDRERLRLPVETLVHAFLGLLFPARVGAPAGPRTVAVEDLVDVFLYGAVKP